MPPRGRPISAPCPAGSVLLRGIRTRRPPAARATSSTCSATSSERRSAPAKPNSSRAEGYERMSAHALRVGFITEAYGKGVRDEDIMRHTRHRDLRTMRGYVQRAGLLTESPAGLLDL
jgi:hypothetical protein